MKSRFAGLIFVTIGLALLLVVFTVPVSIGVFIFLIIASVILNMFGVSILIKFIKDLSQEIPKDNPPSD